MNLTKLSIPIAIITMLGLALHDTKIDKFATIAMVPVMIASYEGLGTLLHGEAHTHVEHVSVQKTANKATSLLPHLQSRQNEDTRYRMGKRSGKGRHLFDNPSLPIVA